MQDCLEMVERNEARVPLNLAKTAIEKRVIRWSIAAFAVMGVVTAIAFGIVLDMSIMAILLSGLWIMICVVVGLKLGLYLRSRMVNQ